MGSSAWASRRSGPPGSISPKLTAVTTNTLLIWHPRSLTRRMLLHSDSARLSGSSADEADGPDGPPPAGAALEPHRDHMDSD